MAYEQRFVPPFTAVALTTGLKAKRFVTVSSTKAATNGGPYVKYSTGGTIVTVGVLLSGSTGSTKANQAVTVMPLNGGIAKVESLGNTLKAGVVVAAGAAGRASTAAAGAKRLGVVVGGSSGTTGRVLSVLLVHPPSTA